MSTDEHDAMRFLEALAGPGAWPDDERLITCGFPGDPNEAPPDAWRPRPWKPGRELLVGSMCNGYVAVASFRRAQDGTWRRRGECFAAGLALMIDDVGTKVALDTVSHTMPSARVETSPGNEQWWYFLDAPLRDAQRFDQMIRAFIAGNLLGADPGMAGVNRVGRLPGFINGKAKYGGDFRTRLLSLDAGRRFTPEALVDAFDLKLIGQRRPLDGRRLMPEDIEARADLWVATFNWLQRRKMFKRIEPDAAGWWEMSCPWVGDHTDRADSGAAMREPHDDNGYYGAFRCHHGHCQDKAWRDLAEWVADESADELEGINNAG